MEESIIKKLIRKFWSTHNSHMLDNLLEDGIWDVRMSVNDLLPTILEEAFHLGKNETKTNN